MAQAHFHFHDCLNDFLPAQRQQVVFTHHFDGSPSIKDMIEALGVPHTEMGLILVNQQPVPFNYHVQPNDTISVYPAVPGSIAPEHAVSPPPVEARFVADVHLGRLAAYLRMLGFDTLYPEDYRDEELARISSEESRILLTRDLGLLKRSIVVYGYYVRETNPWNQLAEVIHRFRLLDAAVQFQRCTRCNAILETADAENVVAQVPPHARQHYSEFRLCRQCEKVYWRGSHFEQMDAFIERLRQQHP